MSSQPKPKCYVASPYGFAESTRQWYYDTLLPLLREHVEVVDPWVIDVTPILEGPESMRTAKLLDVGDHHFDEIKGVQLMVAGLDQEPPDNGTVIEVAWAAAHNIPVVGYRNDLRSGGEGELKFNLMIGAAIRRSGGVEVSTLVELEQAVAEYARKVSSS